MQKPQLAANVVKADLLQLVVVAFKAVVGIPIHALGLVAVAVAIQNACLPAQPFENRVRPTACTVAGLIPLGLVCQLVEKPPSALPAVVTATPG